MNNCKSRIRKGSPGLRDTKPEAQRSRGWTCAKISWVGVYLCPLTLRPDGMNEACQALLGRRARDRRRPNRTLSGPCDHRSSPGAEKKSSQV